MIGGGVDGPVGSTQTEGSCSKNNAGVNRQKMELAVRLALGFCQRRQSELIRISLGALYSTYLAVFHSPRGGLPSGSRRCPNLAMEFGGRADSLTM